MNGRMGTCAAMIAATLALTSGAVGAAPRPPHLYGPELGFEEFRKIGEQYIVNRLIDPESARISWIAGFYKGAFKPIFEARIEGYVSCGLVNAKNRMGGYSGDRSFVVVIDFDRVLYAEMDKNPGGFVSQYCSQALETGVLAPLPLSALANPQPSRGSAEPQPVARSAAGMQLRVMPEGAYVSLVEPGSVAEHAGLKPGMVVSGVNGISLAGMGPAMSKVIDAAGVNASLTIVGGATLQLASKP